MNGLALSQLPERFRSKYDTERKVVNGKQKFFVKGLADSPEFDTLKAAHEFIATLETGKLFQYIHRKYGHYGYKRAKEIEYNPEFSPEYAKRDKYRWVENVTRGLRKVDDADKIVRLNHTGWYNDNFQDETVHGAVYQLPAHSGKTLYVPAVDDPCNPDAACICFSDATEDKEDAARWADRMAEMWAEDSREAQAKEDAEVRLADIEEDIKARYTDFRRIARELRANCDRVKGIAVVSELVRKEWTRAKTDIHKLRAERKRIEREGIQY